MHVYWLYMQKLVSITVSRNCHLVPVVGWMLPPMVAIPICVPSACETICGAMNIHRTSYFDARFATRLDSSSSLLKQGLRLATE